MHAETLTNQSKAVIADLSDRFLRKNEFWVDGRAIRGSMSGDLESKFQSLEKLVKGHYIQRSGKPPDDRYSLTLHGALHGNHRQAFNTTVTEVLRAIQRKEELKRGFGTYDRADLESGSEVLRDVWSGESDARLSNYLMLSELCEPRTNSPPWGRPRDIEHILDVKDAYQLSEMRLDALAKASRRVRSAQTVAPHPDDLMDRIGVVMRSDALRAIVQQDARDLVAAEAHELWKPTMLLAGAILEGVLLDVLGRRADKCQHRMRKGRFPKDARLMQLIEIARDEGLITKLTSDIGQVVRGHRNLIHPRLQLQDGTTVDRHRSTAITSFLRMVVGDLADPSGQERIAKWAKSK